MIRRAGKGAWSGLVYVAPAVTAVAAGLGLWELLARGGWISALLFPPPTRIVMTLVDTTRSGDLTMHLGTTLMRMIPGLALGAGTGLALGLLMGWSAALRRFMDPLVSAVHPIPKITLLPLFMVILGIGETTWIAVIAVSCFFPMVINTMAGVRQISPLYLEVAENYGAGRFRVFADVILPGSLPMVLSGLRLSANVALILTVAVEIISAQTGLGALVWLSWELFRVDLLYATILVVALLGIALRLLLTLLERVALPWERSPPEAA